MRLYYLLGWLISPLAKAAFYVYSRVTGTKRVRLVLENEYGEVLLVKPWPGSNRWGFPGGGIDRGEAPEDAAARELREETGINVDAADLTLLFTLRHAGHEEIVYTAKAPKSSLPAKLPNRFEIKEADWKLVDNVDTLDSLAKRIVQTVALKG